MTNSINNIKLFFDRHKGPQRNNRYSVSFSGLPLGVPQLPPDDIKVASIAMGSRAIDVIADNLIGYGPGRMVPRYQKFVGGILLTFPVTNDNFIVDFFNSWFNVIYAGGRLRGGNRPFELRYYDDIVYNCKMRINLLNPNGDTNKIFNFFEVYPIENLPFEMNMADPNKFLTYTVLLNYREFSIT
jgi:hypothetical protein